MPGVFQPKCMQLVYFNIDKCTWYNRGFAIAVHLLIILSNESVILHHSKKMVTTGEGKL